MAKRVVCRGVWQGQESEGTATLDDESIQFKGDFRVKIAREDVTSSELQGQIIIVRTDEGTLELEVGRLAHKWVAVIQSPPTRVQRMGLRKGFRVWVQRVGDLELLDELQAAGIEADLAGSGKYDAVIVRADDEQELRLALGLQSFLNRRGTLWVVYPRNSKVLSNALVRARAHKAGLTDEVLYRFTSTRIALQLVPSDRY